MPNGIQDTEAPLLISRAAPPLVTMDYARLREDGLAYIQSLASKTWTDHNIHDPGITILEALCYVLTDLGFRTNQDVANLLAGISGQLDIDALGFYPAERILPNAPLTFLDYRKLLIDQDAIRNAWLTPATEISPPLYFDESTDSLSFTAGSPVYLNGLYDILLEFKEDALNSNLFAAVLPAVNGTEYRIEVTFPYWDELPSARPYGMEVDTSNIQLLGGAGDELTPTDSTNFNDYLAALSVPYTGSSYVDQIPLRIKAIPAIIPADRPALELAIIAELERADASNLAVAFNQRVEDTIAVIRDIQQAFNTNRNLCEDVYRFRTVRTQEIALECDIEILPGTDIHYVLEEIYRRIDDFLSPRIRFYSLSEMLEKGYTVDEVFEGPLLRHGFIDSNSLLGNERFNKTADQIIYVSDLFRIISEINDDAGLPSDQRIVSVKNLQISNYINNQRIANGVRNCLKLNLSDTYKPKLSTSKSIIRFFQDGRLIEDESLSDIGIPQPAPEVPVTGLSRALPTGQPVALEDYYSIQHDFPLAYGIGKEGLDDRAPESRRAFTRQLKGFLAVFEQILANYLSQLAHVKSLFAIGPDQEQTYFSQPLYEVPGISALLKDFTISGLSWADFLQDEENDYRLLLNDIGESRNTFLDRRNRVLSHLSARFGEDFSERARVAQALAQKAASTPDEALQLRLTSQAQLIRGKSLLLGEIPKVSMNRGQGFDYHRNTLLRIEPEGGGPIVYRWALQTPDMEPLLSSAQAEASPEDALGRFIEHYHRLTRPGLYNVVPAGGTDFAFELLDAPGGVAIASSSGVFASADEAQSGADAVVELAGTLIGVWDTDNVSGLQYRIGHQLGWKSARQRLLLEPPMDYFSIQNPNPGEFFFTLSDEAGTALLNADPLNPYPDAPGAQVGIAQVMALGIIEDNYEIFQPVPGQYRFRLLGNSSVLAISEAVFNTREDALAARDALCLFIFEKFSREGAYLIEHLLLRPTTSQVQSLLPAFIDSEDTPTQDPYSFRLTVILPSGLEPGDPGTAAVPLRYGDPDFRNFAEKVIRQEAPAHVALNIFWLDEDDLSAFEQAYRRWLIVSSVYPPERENELIRFLQILNLIIDLSIP